MSILRLTVAFKSLFCQLLPRVLALVSAITLFAWGCTTEPGLDKGKFAALYRAAQDLKTAMGSGKCAEVPDTVLQRLAHGTSALKDKTASKAERDLLSAYSHLLATCQDGLLLCRSRTHLTGFPFVPKGRIYVTQELDPIVEKYDLATERHLYGPTGTYWRSISADSIAVIWKRAEAEIKNIENMTNYN
jgi:hypothetical protein